MKKTLLIFIVLVTNFGFGQSTISSFFGTANYSYTNITATPALDHSISGANAAWNFQNLTTNGTTSETNSAPTPTEVSTFPNTNSVHRITTTISSPNNNGNIYSNLSGSNVFSFTGFDSNGIVLNYITNNATVGQFPLSYGFSNNDTTAGTYIYSTYNGTFTGTMTTNYDAYGTLNLGVVGYNPITASVSRIKQVQNINLSYSIMGNIGTVVQTTYTYYIDNVGVIEPFFRDTTYTVSVPFFGFNQTTNQAEVFTNALIPLGTESYNTIVQNLMVYPNPALDSISVSNETSFNINSVFVIDNKGQKILETKETKNIDISCLSTGNYIIQINTDKGSFSKKIIKE